MKQNKRDDLFVASEGDRFYANNTHQHMTV
jgi:hypothetical protein